MIFCILILLFQKSMALFWLFRLNWHLLWLWVKEHSLCLLKWSIFNNLFPFICRSQMSCSRRFLQSSCPRLRSMGVVLPLLNLLKTPGRLQTCLLSSKVLTHWQLPLDCILLCWIDNFINHRYIILSHQIFMTFICIPLFNLFMIRQRRLTIASSLTGFILVHYWVWLLGSLPWSNTFLKFFAVA